MKITKERFVSNWNKSSFVIQVSNEERNQILENQEKLDEIQELIEDADHLFKEDSEELFVSSDEWNKQKKEEWGYLKKILKK